MSRPEFAFDVFDQRRERRTVDRLLAAAADFGVASAFAHPLIHEITVEGFRPNFSPRAFAFKRLLLSEKSSPSLS